MNQSQSLPAVDPSVQDFQSLPSGSRKEYLLKHQEAVSFMLAGLDRRQGLLIDQFTSNQSDSSLVLSALFGDAALMASIFSVSLGSSYPTNEKLAERRILVFGQVDSMLEIIKPLSASGALVIYTDKQESASLLLDEAPFDLVIARCSKDTRTLIDQIAKTNVPLILTREMAYDKSHCLVDARALLPQRNGVLPYEKGKYRIQVLLEQAQKLIDAGN